MLTDSTLTVLPVACWFNLSSLVFTALDSENLSKQVLKKAVTEAC